jgi:hypothetical protein
MKADYAVILGQHFRYPAGSRLYVTEGKAPVIGQPCWIGNDVRGVVAILGAQDRRNRWVRIEGREWRWRRLPKWCPMHAVVGIEFPE